MPRTSLSLPINGLQAMRRLGRVWVVAALLSPSLAASAATVQYFNGSGTPYAVQQECGAPPQVLPGGRDGNFLRLASTVVPNCNNISFPRTDTGAFNYVAASFWFRMTPGPSGKADGMGFALLNTAYYGNEGPVVSGPPLHVPEEPSFTQSLGIGFDIHRADDPLPPEIKRADEPSDNHVSVHFDGKVVGVFSLDKAVLDLASGQWIHAWILVQETGSGYSDVRIILTPDGALETSRFDGRVAVPDMAPYEGRAHFGARSGGLSADHDLDSIAVSFSDTPIPGTFHFFDEPGTGFRLGQHCGPPPAASMSGAAGRFLRLGHASVPSCNSVAFDRSSPGIYRLVLAQFDLRLRPVNGRADGMGFALLNTAIYGNTGAVAPEAPLFVAEEPTFRGSLGIGFDIHKAGDRPAEDPSDNHVSIHFDGRLVASYPIAKTTLDLASGQTVRVIVLARLGHGLSDVFVVLTPLAGGTPVVLPQTSVPGLEPYESRAYFGARSGGESAEQDLDNVSVWWLGIPDPIRYGFWGPVMPWPTVPIHMHLLPTGKVMFWDRHGDGVHPDYWDGHPRIWDPATGEFEMAEMPTYDIFCSGHSFLEDGRLFVAGGHILDNVGQDTATSYDPISDTWIAHPRMSAGRWYPTNTTLGTGEVLVTSGDIDIDPVTHLPRVNDLPEIFGPDVDPPAGIWRQLPAARRALPLYPWMFQAPDGRAFYAGPGPDTAFLDLSGTGQWIPFPTTPNHTDFRGEGSAVLWGTGKILTMGGGGGAAPDLPSNRAETIDITDPAATWVEAAPMAFRRRYLTPTLLPDGKVLVTGGSSLPGISTAGAVMVPEQWDPETRSWSLLAGMYEPRLYHSNALLLPDGRVLVAGGGHPDSNDQHIDHNNAQLYYPPYLFKGARPTIASAPSRVDYGASFQVGTAQAGVIRKAMLIRLGSVTHTFNQEQRTVPLAFFAVPGGLNVTAPADPNLCPPGYYMLFIVDDKGVPSAARILSVRRPSSGGSPTTTSWDEQQ